MLAADNEQVEVQSVNAKWYVLAQYSRHIRPSFEIIDGGADANTVSAFDAQSSKLVIVTTNYDSP